MTADKTLRLTRAEYNLLDVLLQRLMDHEVALARQNDVDLAANVTGDPASIWRQTLALRAVLSEQDAPWSKFYHRRDLGCESS